MLDHSAPGTDGVFSGHKIDGGTVVAVTVSFDAASYTATEDGTDATVTVNLSADPEREVIIPIVGTGKDGGSSGDFSLASATVTIASGSTSGTFKVKAADDDFDDDGETVELSFSGLPNGVTAGSQSTASVSITDDDTRGVVYSTESVRVDEGKRTDNIFTMALTSQPTRATLVEMETAIFTNRDRVDMGIGDRIAVVFDGSNWNTPQPVHMISADRVEENTTLHIKPVFSRSGDRNSDYVGLTVPTVELTIVDRNKPRVADQAVTVLYATSDGTATADGTHEDGADYTAPASDAALIFDAGETSATISIATGDDTVDEDDETFTVTLSDPLSNAVLGTDKTATGTIENNDAASTDAALKALTLKVGGSDVDLTPVFAATTYSYEADVANTAATVNVVAESNHGKATVAISGDDDTTSPGEAALPMAFGENTVTRGVTVSPIVLTVPEGSTATYTVVLTSQPTATVTVTVSAAQDDDAEADEAVLSHAVSGGDYASETASSVDVTVGDDETASTAVALSVNPASVDEGAGATSVTVTGTLDGAPRTADTTVTVPVGASGDGAAEGTDYATVADLTLTIDAGETTGTATFTLTPTDDDVDEGDETLSVTGTTTATDLTVTATTATIVDDDTRRPRCPTRPRTSSGGRPQTAKAALPKRQRR